MSSAGVAKRRKTGETDTAYISRGMSGSAMPSNARESGFNGMTARQSRASALAAEKLGAQAQKDQVKHDSNTAPSVQLPIFPMSSLPPESIHKYLISNNLIPPYTILPGAVPMMAEAQLPPLLDYGRAVQPIPPPSLSGQTSSATSGKRKRKNSLGSNMHPALPHPGTMLSFEMATTEASEGQEPDEADARLVDIATKHWDKTTVKDSETIVQFMFAVRMKDKILKAPSMPML